MATLDDVRDALVDLASGADESPPDAAAAYRHALTASGRRARRPGWLLAAAVVVLLAGSAAALFALLTDSDEQGGDVVTDPEPPPTSPPAGPTTTVVGPDPATLETAASRGWVDSAQTLPPLTDLGFDPVISDGSTYYALAEGRLLRFDTDAWLPVSATEFPYDAAGPAGPLAVLGAARDGTVVIFEGTDWYETVTVHVVAPDGSVQSSDPYDGAPGVTPFATIGPDGILVGIGDTVRRSTDGATWDPVTLPAPQGMDIVAIDQGYVRRDPSGVASFSADLVDWTELLIVDPDASDPAVRFDVLSPFRGGAALWSDSGVGLVDPSGSAVGLLPYPDWAGEMATTAGTLAARAAVRPATSTAGLAVLTGVVDGDNRFDEETSIAFTDGSSWTRVELPADLEFADRATLLATDESIMLVGEGTPWLTFVLDDGRRTFPDPAPSDPAVVAAEEVARTFMDARDRWDGAAVIDLFAPGASIEDGTGLDPRESVSDPAGFGPLWDFYRATDWRWATADCAGGTGTGSTVAVVCPYDHSNAWSRAMTTASGTLGDGRITFEVVDGRITRLEHVLWIMDDTVEVDVDRAWGAFRSFVDTTHPDDVATMYASGSYPRLTPESIELWSTHTDEFVADRS